MFFKAMMKSSLTKAGYGTGFGLGCTTQTIKDYANELLEKLPETGIIDSFNEGYDDGRKFAHEAYEDRKYKREMKRREKRLAEFNVNTPESMIRQKASFDIKENSRKAAEELLDELKKSFVKDEFKEPSVNPAPVEAEPATEEPVNEASVAEESATETPVNPTPQPEAEQTPVNPAPSVPDPGYNDTDILFETDCCVNTAV